MYCQLTEKVQAFGSATLGASSQLRSRLKAGLSKLNDLASTDGGKGADSAWSKSAVTGASKESIMQHVQNLHQVYQHAHAQLKSKLEAHGVVLEKIAGSYMSRRLPLTGFYGPLTALMLMYLVCDIWRHRADMRHCMRQSTEVETVGAEATHAFQQEILLVSEAMVTASVYLAVVPMVIILLVVMELNGSPSWLVISSYTCLLADMLVATNPVLLGGIWPGGDTGDVEQRLAAGITVFIAVCCLAQTVYG
ncbi:hypothetical protein H4S07_003080 [Coemansia furcata]|uniref:Uncharacterized protein n=1 Tax=Coemansia furcata TaxID=417177 RepID=A0ACC1LIV6_9FUNG|nr:hypothetical protein H4S07_003080 [Coemansia furcata]